MGECREDVYLVMKVLTCVCWQRETSGAFRSHFVGCRGELYLTLLCCMMRRLGGEERLEVDAIAESTGVTLWGFVGNDWG